MTARTGSVEAANELLVALASDDAFDAWYRGTVPRVFSYLLARCAGDTALAEDLTQQTFVTAIDRRGAFDGRSDVVTWLCGIARHKLADHYRRLEREERRHLHLVVQEIQVGEQVGGRLGLDERAAVADAFQRLPVSHRAVLSFVVLDGLSVAEAGRLLGRSPGATQSLLHRARESFRRVYGGDLGDD